MLRITSEQKGFEAVFSANFEEIDNLCQKVHDFLGRRGGLEEVAFAVEIGCREAVTNAVRHGSNLDSAKEVKFSITIEQGSLIIKISDQGKGFEWRRFSDQCGTDLKENGRGICILHKYFDNVKYNEPGNKVTLKKKIGKKFRLNKGEGYE